MERVNLSVAEETLDGFLALEQPLCQGDKKMECVDDGVKTSKCKSVLKCLLMDDHICLNEKYINEVSKIGIPKMTAASYKTAEVISYPSICIIPSSTSLSSSSSFLRAGSNTQYTDAHVLNRNILTHSGNIFYKCTTCGVAFRYRIELSRHIHSVHGPVVVNKQKIKCRLNCAHCPYQTKFETQMVNHHKLHEEGVAYVICDKCHWFVHPKLTGFHEQSRHQRRNE